MVKLLDHLPALLVAAVACALPLTAAAQTDKYPNKSIRMLVPFAPGGGTDITARLIAQNMAAALGQQVIVDNRAGGGGTIGAETAVRATPDGYTVIMVSGSYGTNAALYKLPYDPVKDIQPLVMIGESGFVLALHPSVTAKTVPELIAHAKANPGKLNFASTGTGGITHLATELFDLMAGTKMTHIPYKGTGPALSDIIGGQVQVLFGSFPATIPHVKSGKLRGIGVTTAKRAGPLPEVPAIGETVKGYETVLWYGLWGPKGLPKPIITRWNQEVARILQTPEMQKRLADDGVEPAGGPPEQFLNAIRRDVEKWKKVVKAANIKVSS
ncbi:MAG: tripartite tricarboxylate transporter substrate binding protein [Burkholderiales bacterium]|nr:tripartite tricarboxylate transporter substrate binding protein [Burkholderiales bacterium]